jgi:glycosyltransferase involved in cell wall biosynthesis
MMERKKILHIITGLEVGGAERALFNLLTHGLNSQFENHVISLTGVGFYGPLLINSGVKVSAVNIREFTLKSFYKICRIYYKFKPDAIQGWMIHGNLVGAILKFLSFNNCILLWNVRRSLESINAQKKLTRFLTFIAKFISNYPDAIIFNSVKSKSQYMAYGYNNIKSIHIPNGFDVAEWFPCMSDNLFMRQKLNISESDFVIGYVGRGHDDKDPGRLFDAFNVLSVNYPNLVLIAVGRDLSKYAKSTNKIHFMGQRKDIPRLMRVFNLLCLSSKVEGFPNVLGEAMLSGIPCVSTDVGDASEIVGSTGWIVATSAHGSLVSTLEIAINASGLELKARGINARDRILHNYQISSVVERYEKLYNSIL